eukprot:2803355-Rhodomonas_salina.2
MGEVIAQLMGEVMASPPRTHTVSNLHPEIKYKKQTALLVQNVLRLWFLVFVIGVYDEPSTNKDTRTHRAEMATAPKKRETGL